MFQINDNPWAIGAIVLLAAILIIEYRKDVKHALTWFFGFILGLCPVGLLGWGISLLPTFWAITVGGFILALTVLVVCFMMGLSRGR